MKRFIRCIYRAVGWLMAYARSSYIFRICSGNDANAYNAGRSRAFDSQIGKGFDWVIHWPLIHFQPINLWSYPVSKGTIRINGELKPMMPYGCWSDKLMLRCAPMVSHGNGNADSPMWPNRFSVACRYDQHHKDERCTGCKVEKDVEYIDSLK